MKNALLVYVLIGASCSILPLFSMMTHLRRIKAPSSHTKPKLPYCTTAIRSNTTVINNYVQQESEKVASSLEHLHKQYNHNAIPVQERAALIMRKNLLNKISECISTHTTLSGVVLIDHCEQEMGTFIQEQCMMMKTNQDKELIQGEWNKIKNETHNIKRMISSYQKHTPSEE